MSFVTNPSAGIANQNSMNPPGGGSRSFWESLFGRPERNYQQSLLGPEQQTLYNQLLGASQGEGAGGAFGESADYYRSLLSDDNADMDAFAAPEMRRFREQTIPGLAEQFAGMGSGALSSSGFRNSAINAGADLSERLGAIRAGLRQNAAQGLGNIGQQGLQQRNENILRPETFGLTGSFAEGAGQGLGKAAGTYLGTKYG